MWTMCNVQCENRNIGEVLEITRGEFPDPCIFLQHHDSVSWSHPTACVDLMDDLRTRTHTPKTTSAVNEPNCALNTSENLQPLLPFFLFEMFKLSKLLCQNGACFLLNLYLKRLWQWTKVLPGKKCGSAETPKCPPSPHFSNTAAVVLIDGHLTRFLQRKDICLRLQLLDLLFCLHQ